MNASIHDVHQVERSTEGSLLFKVPGVGFLKQYLSPLLMDALKVKTGQSFFVFEETFETLSRIIFLPNRTLKNNGINKLADGRKDIMYRES